MNTKSKDKGPGYIQLYTGEGKGKTTSAIGQIIRALGHELDVQLVTFFKGGETFRRGVRQMLDRLDVPVKNFVSEHPAFGHVSEKRAINECSEGLSWVEEFFEERADDFDLLVLDEINVALRDGLMEERRLISLLGKKPDSLEVILTGRGATSGLIERADLVSEIKKVKHMYDNQVASRPGFEY